MLGARHPVLAIQYQCYLSRCVFMGATDLFLKHHHQVSSDARGYSESFTGLKGLLKLSLSLSPLLSFELPSVVTINTLVNRRKYRAMTKRPAEIALGPMFIGTVFNTILFGIMITQVYLYFDSYKKDRTWLKCFVLFLFLADAINAAFDLVYVYDALIINFNNVEYLVAANWSVFISF